MISSNVEFAIENFVLSYYNDGDLVCAMEAASDFLEGEAELAEFDREMINYLLGNSSIVVEGYNGFEFFPIRLGISGELGIYLSYLKEKIS